MIASSVRDRCASLAEAVPTALQRLPKGSDAVGPRSSQSCGR